MRGLPFVSSFAAVVLVAGCAGRPVTPRARLQEVTIRVEAIEHGVAVVRDVPLEEYVAASALSEFAPAAGEPSAVEAMFEGQAIIARTYAISPRGRHASAGFGPSAPPPGGPP